MKPTTNLTAAIPDKLVVLTFDDALINHYKIVAPELKARGFGGTFYVSELHFAVYGASNYADGVSKNIYMTWSQIAELDQQGFEIGNHTLTHRNMRNMADMKDEISGLEARCLDNNIPEPKTFAYPGLVFTEESVAYLREKGYTFARTGLADTYDPTKQHPLKVMGCDGSFDPAKFADQVSKAKDGNIVVLIYHDVQNRAAFAKTMDHLKNNQYTVISMNALSNYIDSKKAIEYFEKT